jgi:hypothetical protein
MPFWFEVIQKVRSLPELTAEVWLRWKSGVKPVFSWAINGMDRMARIIIKRNLTGVKMKE